MVLEAASDPGRNICLHGCISGGGRYLLPADAVCRSAVHYFPAYLAGTEYETIEIESFFVTGCFSAESAGRGNLGLLHTGAADLFYAKGQKRSPEI